MNARRVLLLTAQRLTAYHWQGGRLGESLSFSPDEQGLHQFAEYLDAWPPTPIYFLVDMVEEEFREENVPHVIGGERKSVLDIRISRMFQDTTFVRTSKLGRESSGRRDDRMLFSALLRPDQLSPWLSNIERRELPVAGVYTVASVTNLLLKAVPVDSRHALVVTQQSGGLRQSLFVDGRLRLSRLAVVPRLQRRVQSSYILGEIEKFRRYLTPMRLLPQDTELDVYVLSDEPTLEALRRQMPTDVNARLNRVPLSQVAKRLGCADLGKGPGADAVFAYLLARHTPDNAYAPDRLTRDFKRVRVGRMLKAASLLVLVGAFAWSSVTALRAIGRAQETQDLRERTAFYQDRYQRARGRLPSAPTSAANLEGVVDVAGRFADYSARPASVLTAVGGVLGRHPELKLESIEWGSVVGGEDAVALSPGLASVLSDAVATAFGSASAQPQNPTPPAFFVVTLRGEVAHFAGDYRAALVDVRSLADDLRALPGAREVELLSLPLAVGSQDSLSGDANDGETVRRAPFEVAVVLERQDVPGATPDAAAAARTTGPIARGGRV